MYSSVAAQVGLLMLVEDLMYSSVAAQVGLLMLVADSCIQLLPHKLDC